MPKEQEKKRKRKEERSGGEGVQTKHGRKKNIDIERKLGRPIEFIGKSKKEGRAASSWETKINSRACPE